jgi:D-beta-D-heptose 7-phosphate kinase/D-beta-D-heptose 1-phosphate adenosyltransferase
MSTVVDFVRHFRQLRALVIGDAMLDTYLEGTAARLCREGPVPVVRKTGEHRIPGGAANTAANLHALDAEVYFLGIVGQDMTGAALRSSLREQGVDDRWLVEDASTSTLHKLRIVADGQYVVRLDEDARQHSIESREQLLANLEEVFSRCDLVVVSDYGYGSVSDALIDRLRTLRSLHWCPLLVDSKNLYRFRNVGATIVTPNHQEARLLVEPGRAGEPPASGPGIDLSEVKLLGRRLLKLIDAEHAAITMAEDGVFLIDRQGMMRHLPAHTVAHANDIGAGDSFAAAMALALATGGDVEEAARIAIDAVSIAVTKRWTAVVSHQELLQRVSLRDHSAHSCSLVSVSEVWSPASITQLTAQLDAQRLHGQTIVFTNGVFDILHAGHIELLRRAKELGDVLIVGVNSDRSAQRLKGKSRPINSQRDRVALVTALDPVDHVVLFDEDTPAKLIRMLRPHIHVKGGDYVDEVLPEAEAVREVGGRIVILPLAVSISTSSVIDRIIALASDERIEVER